MPALQNTPTSKDDIAMDTFLVSLLSVRTLMDSSNKSRAASTMAKISAFSMSFEPARSVCVCMYV